MIDQSQIKEWGGWILGGFGTAVAVWAKFGIRRLDVKTDGYLSWRSRAEIAEAILKEKDFNRDRGDQKEERDYDRKKERDIHGTH